MAKVYKLEILLIDHEEYPDDVVIEAIENLKHFYPTVIDYDSVKVEWSDDHPLNKQETWRQEYNQMFS